MWGHHGYIRECSLNWGYHAYIRGCSTSIPGYAQYRSRYSTQHVLLKLGENALLLIAFLMIFSMAKLDAYVYVYDFFMFCLCLCLPERLQMVTKN